MEMQREKAFYCAACEAWFQCVDQKWITCPEPKPRQDGERVDADPPKEELPGRDSNNQALPAQGPPAAGEMSQPENPAKNEEGTLLRGSDPARSGAADSNAPVDPEVFEYLGGLVTVTTIRGGDDDSDED